MEGTGGAASNQSDVQAEEITDPVSRYSSVCANEQLNRCSPAAPHFLKHSILIWISQCEHRFLLIWVLEKEILQKKNNLISQAVGTRLTESLKKLIESLDLYSQKAKGNEQMDRLERRSPNSDRQNNYPPHIWKCICISHGRCDPFGWLATAPSHGGEARVWFTVAPLCAEASGQTFQSDDCLIMS